MSSKTKKGKKKPKVISDVSKSKENLTNKKIHTYFTNEEIAEIKSVMKVKDVTGVPFITAATILYKLDLIKRLLNEGFNINQTSQNNMTALMWAVKYKFLDVIDFLLENGADPNIKTDSGDNILTLALEHKLWDEESIIKLWNSFKRICCTDINSTNKNGHNILHMCVRRDWENFLKILLSEKPDIDAGNSNGVTPLMLASFRNNVNIINILIDAGADILKEDNHGRMTLCYAISSSMKISKPPFLAAEKVVSELRKRSLFETYLKRRLELIIITAKKNEVSCTTSEMLIKIMQFAVQYTEEGISVFLECDVFSRLLEVLKTQLETISVVKFLLEVCEEILFYNEQSVGYKPEIHNKVINSFFKSGWVETILELLRNHTEETQTAFNLLLLGFNNEKRWEKIIEENYNDILTYLNEGLITIQDETRSKILKNKKRKLKKLYESLEIVPLTLTDSSDRFDERKKDNSINTKKSRRRSKAIKAKLTKIKSAEFSKRLNLGGRRLTQTRSNKTLRANSLEKIELLLQTETKFETENPIVSSFHHLLDDSNDNNNCDEKQKNDIFPKWKKHILSISHDDSCKNIQIDQKKLRNCLEHLKESSHKPKFDLNINRSVNVLVDYIRQLVQLICRKYKEHWENNRMSGDCNCFDQNEHVPWLYTKHLKSLEIREKQIIQNLQKSLDGWIKSVKDLAHKDLKQCLKSFNTIEATLLNYEIRGIKVISYVCGMENFTIKYSTTNTNLDDTAVLEYVQNVVNDVEKIRPDVEIEITDNEEDASFMEIYKNETPLELYYREMSMVGTTRPRNKRKEIESKLNTIANGFHLINSIMSICDEVDDGQIHQKYGISDLNHPLRHKYPKSFHYSEISEYMPKRLKSQISSLQNSKNFQKLLGGEIRIATKEQRVNYIISAGINFNAVELGLDINNQPLAVKRIPRESWVGKIIKTLVDPLLGLIDNHILHYFACEYEDNELILATPLCKWTMAQYVQLLRQSSSTTMPGLTGIQIVKQFLDGLMVLHKCEIPIVHGNLKPSNIFIDFNGLVKIAEFGIHKALYKIIEAPKSSLIWFAKETLDIYKNSSIVECSIKSDIQVAGMLMYFILTYGKHPFGEDTEEIIKNIQRGVLKLGVRNLDLRDLLSWMMMSDFNERPNVEQVLAHTFFWSPSKKWSFILCCSGINQNGYILPINVDKLHRSIDTFGDAYIKIEWHEIVRSRFPFVRITENNNVVGLLKFIKNCHDHRLETNITDTDLSCAILSLFPALPVSLYRTLQNTNWLKNAIFMPFSDVF